PSTRSLRPAKEMWERSAGRISVAGHNRTDARLAWLTLWRAAARETPPPESPAHKGRGNGTERCLEGSGGLGVDALAVQEGAQLAGVVHLADDVAAADELALDVELRNRRPLREVLDALAQGGVGQHVDALELDAELAQHLNHGRGESALREYRRALHVEDDVVLRDVLLDAIEDRVGHGRGHASVSFRLSYFGMAVCRA